MLVLYAMQVVSLAAEPIPAVRSELPWDSHEVALVVGWAMKAGKRRAPRLGCIHLINPSFQVRLRPYCPVFCVKRSGSSF